MKSLAASNIFSYTIKFFVIQSCQHPPTSTRLYLEIIAKKAHVRYVTPSVKQKQSQRQRLIKHIRGLASTRCYLKEKVVKKDVLLLCLGILLTSSLNAMNSTSGRLYIEQTSGTEEDREFFVTVYTAYYKKHIPSVDPEKHSIQLFDNEKVRLQKGQALGIHIKDEDQDAITLFISCEFSQNNEIILMRRYAPSGKCPIDKMLVAIQAFFSQNYSSVKKIIIPTIKNKFSSLESFKKFGFTETTFDPEHYNPDDWTILALSLPQNQNNHQ
jgi:hypothetical protein